MAAQTHAPIQEIAPNALTLIGAATPPVGEEWSVDIRVANATDVDAFYRLVLHPVGVAAAGVPMRVPDIRIPARDARNVETKLTIPEGWTFSHRASAANSLHVSITARTRKAN